MPTIGTWLNAIGRKQALEECPAWPRDLYALAGTLIPRSGAYLQVFHHKGPANYLKGVEERWLTGVRGSMKSLPTRWACRIFVPFVWLPRRRSSVRAVR